MDFFFFFFCWMTGFLWALWQSTSTVLCVPHIPQLSPKNSWMTAISHLHNDNNRYEVDLLFLSPISILLLFYPLWYFFYLHRFTIFTPLKDCFYASTPILSPKASVSMNLRQGRNCIDTPLVFWNYKDHFNQNILRRDYNSGSF